MNQLLQTLLEFGQSSSAWVYVFIFFGKIFEVTISVLRIVLINRGERVIGSIVSLVEIFSWLLVTGTVLIGFQSDYVKVIVFCVAFGIGNFLGSWMEEKLAFGLCSVQAVITKREHADVIAAELCKNGFGVTRLVVSGRDDEPHYMVVTTLKRKLAREAIKIIESLYPKASITVTDVKSQKGGYLRNASLRRTRILHK